MMFDRKKIRKRIRRFRRRVRNRLQATWLWDKLFLDFYLDKRWTFRFKLMNFISQGVLLGDVVQAQVALKHMHDRDKDLSDPDLTEEYRAVLEDLKDWHIRFYSKRAEYLLNSAMDCWLTVEDERW